MKWEFTPDEFLHVWAETGLDRYPSPLALLSSIQWEHDFLTLSRDLCARLPPGGDPDLTPAPRAAAFPDSTLTLTGSVERPIRAYGAIAGRMGVLFAQRTTADPIYGGNVVIQVGTPALIPKVFAALAGNVPPGGRGPLVESIDRLRLEQEAWVGTKETVGTRIRRLLATPRSGAGHVTVAHRLRTG